MDFIFVLRIVIINIKEFFVEFVIFSEICKKKFFNGSNAQLVHYKGILQLISLEIILQINFISSLFDLNCV